MAKKMRMVHQMENSMETSLVLLKACWTEILRERSMEHYLEIPMESKKACWTEIAMVH